MKSKLSQTEIVGLMIIVVIITFIVLFVVSVVYFKPVEDPLQGFIQKDLSTSIISSILKTDSGCTTDTTIEDLLIDMVKAGGSSTILCKLDNIEQRYGTLPDSNPECQTINKGDDAVRCAMSQILTPLKDMGVPFHFKARSGQLPLFEVKNLEEEFGRAKKMDVTPYSLPIYPTTEILEIWLCIGGECPNI